MKEGNKIYAVIDTNVLVSSLFSADGTSNPAIVITAVLKGEIIPLYCKEIIEEYQEVLSRKKFNFHPALTENLLSVFIEFGIEGERAAIEWGDFPDPDDIIFYEIAMNADDAYLVTGNIKHFPANPIVVTPAQMVEILQRPRKAR